MHRKHRKHQSCALTMYLVGAAHLTDEHPPVAQLHTEAFSDQVCEILGSGVVVHDE